MRPYILQTPVCGFCFHAELDDSAFRSPTDESDREIMEEPADAFSRRRAFLWNLFSGEGGFFFYTTGNFISCRIKKRRSAEDTGVGKEESCVAGKRFDDRAQKGSP